MWRVPQGQGWGGCAFLGAGQRGSQGALSRAWEEGLGASRGPLARPRLVVGGAGQWGVALREGVGRPPLARVAAQAPCSLPSRSAGARHRTGNVTLRRWRGAISAEIRSTWARKAAAAPALAAAGAGGWAGLGVAGAHSPSRPPSEPPLPQCVAELRQHRGPGPVRRGCHLPLGQLLTAQRLGPLAAAGHHRQCRPRLDPVHVQGGWVGLQGLRVPGHLSRTL